MKNYILKNKQPVAVDDILEWAKWFESADRTVMKTEVGKITVSTVFLGIDHDFTGHGPPMLFETMIFGGEHDQYQERCSTWEEAEKMHEKALTLAQ